MSEHGCRSIMRFSFRNSARGHKRNRSFTFVNDHKSTESYIETWCVCMFSCKQGISREPFLVEDQWVQQCHYRCHSSEECSIFSDCLCTTAATETPHVHERFVMRLDPALSLPSPRSETNAHITQAVASCPGTSTHGEVQGLIGGFPPACDVVQGITSGTTPVLHFINVTAY